MVQSTDVDINGPCTHKGLRLPYLGQKMLSSEHPAWILHEESEQLKLHPGQAHRSSIRGHVVGGQVQDYFADAQQ